MPGTGLHGGPKAGVAARLAATLQDPSSSSAASAQPLRASPLPTAQVQRSPYPGVDPNMVDATMKVRMHAGQGFSYWALYAA